MAFFLLLLAALALQSQTVTSLSPSGDGAGLEPLLKVTFSAPIDPNTLRDRVFVVWGDPVQTTGFTTYPTGYTMPINYVGWDPKTNTMYAKPDEPLDHDRNYRLTVSDGPRLLAGSNFRTRNVTRTILARDFGPAASLTRVTNTIVDLNEVKAISQLTQISADPKAPLTEAVFPVDPSFLTTLGLRRLAFFRYASPGGGTVDVHAWLPNAPPPPSGYPVVLIGHGLGDSRFSGPTLFASAFISNSVVLAIDAVGHGGGPASQIRFDTKSGGSILVPTPGRGRDLNGDGAIDAGEGCIVFTPTNPDFITTCLRETALDYRKLVREIQQGIDLDGDGRNDLDPNRIQYLGQSLGAMYGTLLLALDPSVEAAVLNVGGGSAIEAARYSPYLRFILQLYIASVAPDLADFPDPLIGRYQPVRILDNPKSGRLLDLLDALATAGSDGAPASFAPFLKQATLYGNPIKRVLFQFALGDQTIPNPASGQLIRAAFEYDLVSVYRHDLARQVVPTLPENPHIYLAAFAQLDQQPSLLIGLATLAQASAFLSSGKREVPDVNPLVRGLFGRNLFETPTLLP